MNRQAAPMAQAPVRADLHQASYVERGLPAEVSLDAVLSLQHLSELTDFCFGQIPHSGIGIHPSPLENTLAGCGSYPVNVGQGDFDPFIPRQVYSCNPCHRLHLRLALPLFVFRINANDPDHAFAFDHFALLTHLLD
jgi:hypothetical protein